MYRAPNPSIWRDGRGRRVRGLAPPEAWAAMAPALAGLPAPSALPVTRVVLASCHLDHDPTNNRPRNLAALCQRCHMRHDAAAHRRTRWRRAFARAAMGDLFAARR